MSDKTKEKLRQANLGRKMPESFKQKARERIANMKRDDKGRLLKYKEE